MLDYEMVAAWREAASSLGIRVVAPHSFQVADGTTVSVEAFLLDFGGPQGVVAVAFDDSERCSQAHTSGALVSQLAASYRRFNADLFRDTLNDWGWFGLSDDRPAWYTGKPWS